MNQLILRKPDDWHVHLRDGTSLNAVAKDTAAQFGRALVMPNLRPPVTTVKSARTYRQTILEALDPESRFDPHMALYLTQATTKEDVLEASESPEILGFKLYPAGATTNSDAGVADLERLYPIFASMERSDVPLMIHGEVTDPSVDIFDREAAFIERHLIAMTDRFPGLRIVLEHITTQDAVDFVKGARDGVAATITAHHLLSNRNALFEGGLRPHNYCLPVLKREVHRRSLIVAATSRNPRFFLGTDSAPHPRSAKESACGCAGCYTASSAMALYATAFESVDAIDSLEAFSSQHGADFYRLPRNEETLTLIRAEHAIPDSLTYGTESLVPFFAGKTLNWSIAKTR